MYPGNGKLLITSAMHRWRDAEAAAFWVRIVMQVAIPLDIEIRTPREGVGLRGPFPAVPSSMAQAFVFGF
jgi:hypothetical protein